MVSTAATTAFVTGGDDSSVRLSQDDVQLRSRLVAAINWGEFYLPLIIILLGVPGNLISFLVMVQRQNRERSTGVYMASLAVIDTLALCISLFLYWLFFNFFKNSDFQWACSLFRFLVQFLTQISTYYVLAMTFDRFLSICFPLKTRRFSTSRMALRVTIAIPTALFLINMHGFWTYQLITISEIGQKKCIFYTTEEATKIYTWWELTLTTVFPFVSLIVLNVWIIVKLSRGNDGVGESVDQGLCGF